MNLEKLVSNHDIERFVKSQNLSQPCIFFEDKIPHPSVLFAGHNSFAVIFLFNEGTDVGHWVLLINRSTERNKVVEYFDCLGKRPRKSISNIFSREDWTMICLNKPLMAPDGILCGKWVVARVQSKYTPLQTFYDMFTSSSKFTPDELVDGLYRLDPLE